MQINKSDLMIINRAIAHDNAPRDKAFFIDDEGKYVPYFKRKPTIMSGKETAKDIEVSAGKMLRSLPEKEARTIRLKFSSEEKARDRHLKIVLEVVSKYSSFAELKEFAPNILNLTTYVSK
ncbi:hypothetical protein [Methylobacter tundripaludum]